MPFDDRTAIALDAIRPRIELFHSAVAATTEQIRSLLDGTGVTEEDQTVALGNFASGHVDVDRFSAFTRQAAKVDQTAELPIRTAQKVLNDLLKKGDKLFVLDLVEGASLAQAVAKRLSKIGRAFSAAKVVDLAKRGEYREEEHALLLDGLAYCDWSQAERALAPGLVIRLDGADFVPVQVAAYFDAGMKYVFEVDGDAPAAAMSRLVTPGAFVQQQTSDDALEAFAAFGGAAAAALLPQGAAQFVHDPAAGETSFERFTALEFPKEVRKRSIGGISVNQQAEDYAHLETMAVVPTPGGEAASDPAGKLSAWLLSQTDLVGAGKN
jgi:hypothetical protein